MPARKAAKKAASADAEATPPAKKAARKSPAKKAAAKKTTAKKAAKTAATKTAAPKKPRKKAATPSLEPISQEVAAYLNYRKRVENGEDGDQMSDWLSAGSS